jgi:hypothetical protein
VAAFFSGDGEALDFTAGPSTDWRTPLDTEGMSEEEVEQAWAGVVSAQYDDLDEGSAMRALQATQQAKVKRQDPLSILITSAAVSVAVVLLLMCYSFVETRGGLAQTLSFGGGA